MARAISSLRFISTLYVPKQQQDVTAYLDKDYDGEEFAWWRVVVHEGNAASGLLFDAVPSEAGERIHRHLLSEPFEQTLDMDGAS